MRSFIFLRPIDLESVGDGFPVPVRVNKPSLLWGCTFIGVGVAALGDPVMRVNRPGATGGETPPLRIGHITPFRFIFPIGNWYP